MNELFAKGDTVSTFRIRSDKLIGAIKGFSDEKILGADFDEWVQYFFDEYKIQPITLFLDKVSQRLSETVIKRYNHFHKLSDYEPKYFNVEGYKITFTIPFDGDSELLYLQPSTRLLTRFPIERVKNSTEGSYGEIDFTLEYTKQELEKKDSQKEFIKTQFTERFRGYITMIEHINSEVGQHNETLESVIKNTLESRRKKADDYVAMGKMLDIPLNINPDAPNTLPILLKKVAVKKPELPSAKKPEKEYQITPSDYTNIKRIVNLAGFSMEKSAKTFSKFSEEELRDVIIS